MTKLVDIVQGPWAITPEMLTTIVGIYGRHLAGPKIDLQDLEAKIGKPLGNARPAYRVQDRVALIEIDGVMGKKMNLFMEISGGTSMQVLGNEIKKAVADRDVDSILLVIDSPGGTVDGTQELAELVREAGKEKPIHAFVDGLMASAAYWVGSAAETITLSAGTAYVGSIGVVAAHVDYSRWEEKQGIKTTELTAGKYKRINSEYEPLSAEGRAYMESQLDKLYQLFVEGVAENRGVSVETVLKDMADGRLFIGQDAITADLADGVSDLDSLVARMAAGDFPKRSTKTPAKSAGVRTQAVQPKETPMTTLTIESLRAEHPDLASALEQSGVEKGAAAERARIQAVEAACLPGHEKLIAGLKFDGKTTGPEAAMAIVQAEKTARATTLSTIGADAPKPLPSAPAPDAPKADDLPIEQRIKAEWDASASLRSQFADDFTVYSATRKAELSGAVRVLGRRAA